MWSHYQDSDATNIPLAAGGTVVVTAADVVGGAVDVVGTDVVELVVEPRKWGEELKLILFSNDISTELNFNSTRKLLLRNSKWADINSLSRKNKAWRLDACWDYQKVWSGFSHFFKPRSWLSFLFLKNCLQLGCIQGLLKESLVVFCSNPSGYCSRCWKG